LVAPGGHAYTATSVFLTDASHAAATFAMSGLPTGTYGAQVTENGTVVSLSNALTVTAGSSSTTSGVQIDIAAPQDFRAGFPFEVTLNYTNISGTDLVAPLIWFSATGASLVEQAPQCAGCNANFPLMYQDLYNSGLILGIANQGPAGVLPAGAQGSVTFIATPTSGDITFSAESIDPASPDPLIGYTIQDVHNPLCPISSSTGKNSLHPEDLVCNQPTAVSDGLFSDAASLCSAFVPPFRSVVGFTRTCMQFLVASGYKNDACVSGVAGSCATLDGFGVNSLLAADATAFSQSGTYTSDGGTLLQAELENDGLNTFDKRYHQGAFGFGTSHEFDITAEVYNNAPVIHYPDGTSRLFPTVSPTQANQFLGSVGDYGIVSIGTDGTWTLTETNGIIYHFLLDTQNTSNGRQVLDYIQDLNGNRTTYSYTNDQVTGAIDNFGNTLTFVYDSMGHILQATDPVGRVTTYAYDIKNDIPDFGHKRQWYNQANLE
jgi:YD repeat-containing protein